MHSKTDVENEEDGVPIGRDTVVRWAAEVLERRRGYRNLKSLGSGTFGDVRLMHDPTRNKSVAVKMVEGDRTSEGELRLWPHLHHLNVVPLLELMFLGEGRRAVAVFVMPAESKTLIDALYEWYAVQLDSVPFWLHDVLLGLEYLHSRDLCHMDIKADNVLISEGKVARICDFTFLNETTKTLTSCHVGSPRIYEPPEACQSLGRGVRVDGRACDMWCFGLMCLEVLTRFKLDRYTLKSEDSSFSWLDNVYPAIFKMIQERNFFRLMNSAFVCARISRSYSLRVLGFLHGFLMIDSEKRMTAKEAQGHAFLKRGTLTGHPPHPFWTHRVPADSKGRKIFKKICIKKNYSKDENAEKDKIETKIDQDGTRDESPNAEENGSKISEKDDLSPKQDGISIVDEKSGMEEAEYRNDATHEEDSNNNIIQTEDENTSKKTKKRPAIANILRRIRKRFGRGRKVRPEEVDKEKIGVEKSLKSTEGQMSNVQDKKGSIEDVKDGNQNIPSESVENESSALKMELSRDNFEEVDVLSIGSYLADLKFLFMASTEDKVDDAKEARVIVGDAEEVQPVFAEMEASGEICFQSSVPKSSQKSEKALDLCEVFESEEAVDEKGALEEITGEGNKILDVDTSGKSGRFRKCVNWIRKKVRRNGK